MQRETIESVLIIAIIFGSCWVLVHLVLRVEIVKQGSHRYFRCLTLKIGANSGVSLLSMVVVSSWNTCFFVYLVVKMTLLAQLPLRLWYIGTDFDDLEASKPGKMSVLNYTQAGICVSPKFSLSFIFWQGLIFTFFYICLWCVLYSLLNFLYQIFIRLIFFNFSTRDNGTTFFHAFTFYLSIEASSFLEDATSLYITL